MKTWMLVLAGGAVLTFFVHKTHEMAGYAAAVVTGLVAYHFYKQQ